MESVSLERLETERKRLWEAREIIKNNLVAHDGAIQLADQLILIAKNEQKENAPGDTDEGSKIGPRDAPADKQTAPSQKGK